MFRPSAVLAADADGSTHRWLVETRDFPTGNGNVNTVRRIRARYELEDSAAGALSDSHNLIANPGFEKGALGTGAPPSWAQASSGAWIVTAFTANDWAATGEKFYYAATQVDGYHTLSQTFPLGAGEFVGFGFTRKIGTTGIVGPMYLRAEFLNASAVVLDVAYAGRDTAIAPGLVDSPSGSALRRRERPHVA